MVFNSRVQRDKFTGQCFKCGADRERGKVCEYCFPKLTEREE